MRFIFSLLLILAVSAILTGCGGGGSGGGPSTPPPSSVGTLVVKLRDPANEPIDGIVTVAGRERGTTNGAVTFTGVPVGAQTVSAEVGGQTTTRTVQVAGGTTTNFVFVVTPNTNPGTGPTAPPPPPPL